MLYHMLETKFVAGNDIDNISKMHSLAKTLNLLSCRKLCSQSFYVDRWDFCGFFTSKNFHENVSVSRC